LQCKVNQEKKRRNENETKQKEQQTYTQYSLLQQNCIIDARQQRANQSVPKLILRDLAKVALEIVHDRFPILDRMSRLLHEN
jgi:hypothetical protein